MKHKKELTLEDLNLTLTEIKNTLESRKDTELHLQELIEQYKRSIKESQINEKEYEKNIFNLKTENLRLLKDIEGLQYRVSLYESSKSWKVTYPLRYTVKTLAKFKKLFVKLIQDPSLIKKAAVATRKHGLRYSINKISAMVQDYTPQRVEFTFDLLSQNTVYILTTKHCFYIANLIKANLNKLNISSEIIFEKPKNGFVKGLHFVICPQMFNQLPESYISFQLEQSVSSRWFTDDYINKLENSYAILDYSLKNIDFLQKKGLHYQQMYFMPIGYNKNYETDYLNHQDEEYDVLFYGDVNNERRKKYLEELNKRFKVKVVSEVFGDELYKELQKAKIIVNIHYYEGALLETTRLFECLSLGKLIVSETSSDISEHTTLENTVDFVPVNDIQAMCERVSYWLEDSNRRKEKISYNIKFLNCSPNWFEYYFMRFMLANDWISFDKFYQLSGKHIKFNSDFVCLGLPESTERAKDFQKDNCYGIDYFPGLRHRKGWIGCGLSYKFIFKKAQEQNFNDVIICEDDVEFKEDFSIHLKEIRSYLSTKDNWDLFSGVIADLHSDVKIKSIEKVNNQEYIYIDKMTSMVMNIYSSRFFEKIISWNENNHDVSNNAIDRYIENSSNITTVTRIPYLVGHKEELNSTLWGFKNNVYSEMIKNSELALKDKVNAYQKNIAK